MNRIVFVMLVKFVFGRINGIFDGAETETRKFNYCLMRGYSGNEKYEN